MSSIEKFYSDSKKVIFSYRDFSSRFYPRKGAGMKVNEQRRMRRGRKGKSSPKLQVRDGDMICCV
jgi:hypothetical protein